MAKKRKRKNRVDVIPPVCEYCGGTAKCVDSELIYGKSYGPSWVCVNYPQCDAYVGCHPGTKRPLGRLANYQLRDAKKRAHAAFDQLWRSGKLNRSYAYQLLAEALGIPAKECHIGMMDVELCLRVIEVSEHLKAVQC